MKTTPLKLAFTGLLLVLTACPGPAAGFTGEKGAVRMQNWPGGTAAAVSFVNLNNLEAVANVEVSNRGEFDYRLPTPDASDLVPVGDLLYSGCSANPATANLAPVTAIGQTEDKQSFYPFAIDFPFEAPSLREGDRLFNYLDGFDVGWYYSDRDVEITCSGSSDKLKFRKGWNLSVVEITEVQDGTITDARQISPDSLDSSFVFYPEFGAARSLRLEAEGFTGILNPEYRARAARLLER
ncbi:hypothetical protein [Calidithermus chliarophilus]|uniref:hypothetical protein n=1 Tax=Calidithermus chliarophilus TaxID=52023 RepID=UPI00041C4841|nr:hypothetical protein [Calidithermus chliarophilus]